MRRDCLFPFLAALFLLSSYSCDANSKSREAPKVWNLTNKNFFFVGREEIIQKISSFFKTNPMRILALTGGPGFGKSQLAKKYAHSSCYRYTLIWWMDASQDLTHQFEELAVALNALLSPEEKITPSQLSKESLIYAVKNILRLKKIKYLLIFDNTTSYDPIEKFIPYSDNQRSQDVLITSRNATLWPETMGIGKFKRSESLQLVQRMLPQENKKSIEVLSSTLDDWRCCINE